ncbi:Hypothetical protein R9X50_00270500 [Acrodontium crateriforme]|uniref:Uncharacterized protein n=1 Tax=Acrodontium crateriforme TaxID=150365 RepID=A0AAQ3R3P3_9PEZI|nr:Hypothetical protein R9X50_00270500 [Acrodontium crateriforme]
MCLVEKKTYIHPDGRSEFVETTHRCMRATGSRLCARTVHQNSEVARLVEVKPTNEEPVPSSKGVIITQGRDGRERHYRDVTRRVSKRILKRNSANTANEWSPVESPSSPSSISAFDVRPSAPTPPPPFSDTMFPPRPRVAFHDDDNNLVAPNGTPIHNRAPPFDFPRMNDRLSGAYSLYDEPSSPIPTTPGSASPGLSQLPRVGNLKHDSARDLPFKDGQDTIKYRPRASVGDNQRPGMADPGRRQRGQQSRDDDDRQAQVQRNRQAEHERRQEASRNAEAHAKEKSRELHRREAVEALEGKRDDLRQQQIDAELAQMARERAKADLRSRDSLGSRPLLDDRIRRDADEYAHAIEPATSSNMALASTAAPYGAATVHQYPSARVVTNFQQRGEDVIARERVMLSSQRLADVMGNLDVGDENDDDLVDPRYVDGSRRVRVDEKRQKQKRR